LESLYSNLFFKYSKSFKHTEPKDIDDFMITREILFDKPDCLWSIINTDEIKDLSALKSNMAHLDLNLHEQGAKLINLRLKRGQVDWWLMLLMIVISSKPEFDKRLLDEPLTELRDIHGLMVLPSHLCHDKEILETMKDFNTCFYETEIDCTDELKDMRKASKPMNKQLISLQLLNIFICDPLLDAGAFRTRVENLGLQSEMTRFLEIMLGIQNRSNYHEAKLAIGIYAVMKKENPKAPLWSGAESKSLKADYPDLLSLLNQINRLVESEKIDEDGIKAISLFMSNQNRPLLKLLGIMAFQSIESFNPTPKKGLFDTKKSISKIVTFDDPGASFVRLIKESGMQEQPQDHSFQSRLAIVERLLKVDPSRDFDENSDLIRCLPRKFVLMARQLLTNPAQPIPEVHGDGSFKSFKSVKELVAVTSLMHSVHELSLALTSEFSRKVSIRDFDVTDDHASDDDDEFGRNSRLEPFKKSLEGVLDIDTTLNKDVLKGMKDVLEKVDLPNVVVSQFDKKELEFRRLVTEICKYFNGIISEIFPQNPGKSLHEISFFRATQENLFKTNLNLQEIYDNWSGAPSERTLGTTKSFFKLFLKTFLIETPRPLKLEPFFEYKESTSALGMEINDLLRLMGLEDMIDPVGADYYKRTWDLTCKIRNELKESLETEWKNTLTEYDYILGEVVERAQKDILDKETTIQVLFERRYFEDSNSPVLNLFRKGAYKLKDLQLLRNAINVEWAAVNKIGTVEQPPAPENESASETQRRRNEMKRIDCIDKILRSNKSNHPELYQHFYLELATYLRNSPQDLSSSPNGSLVVSIVSNLSSQSAGPRPPASTRPEQSTKRDKYFSPILELISEAQGEPFLWKNLTIYEARTLFNTMEMIVKLGPRK
jgi:hypothetical protein